MEPSLRQKVRKPEVRTLRMSSIVGVRDTLQENGVFVIPFERGNLIAELMVVNDQNTPVPLVCLRMQREGNNYWFGRIFILNDFDEKLLQEDGVIVMKDEQERVIPNTPEDRLIHTLRMMVLPRSYEQKVKWAFWTNDAWTTAIIAKLTLLENQPYGAITRR